MPPHSHKTTLGRWLDYTAAHVLIGLTCVAGLVLTVFALMIQACIGVSPDEIKQTYGRQYAAVEVFTDTDKAGDPQARQQLAMSLLYVSDQGVSVDMLKDHTVMSQVKQIAATGARINLHPKPFSFWERFKVSLIVIASLMYLVLMVGLYLAHLGYAEAYKTPYRNLPWRAPWTWLLVLLSPLLLWVFYCEYAAVKQRNKAKRAASKQG